MRRAIVFEAERTAYSIGQLFEGNSWDEPMTVGDLMGILEDYDEDDVVVLSHDRGYTYGGFGEQSEWSEDDDGEDEGAIDGVIMRTDGDEIEIFTKRLKEYGLTLKIN